MDHYIFKNHGLFKRLILKVFLYEHVKIFLTIIFMLILVISAIVTGKNWKSETHETKA